LTALFRNQRTWQLAGQLRREWRFRLYFMVGALIVAVGVLLFLSFNGSLGQSREERAIERSADAIGDAARDIGDSVGDAARTAPLATPPATEPLPEPAPAPKTQNP
jgi:hypothetical protein